MPDSPAADASRTLRVTGAGASHQVRHLLEAFVLRSGWEVFQLPPDPSSHQTQTEALIPGVQPAPQSDRGFRSPSSPGQIELLVMDGSRTDAALLAQTALHSGWRVLIVPPVALQPEELGVLSSSVLTPGQTCGVWRPRRCDPDFRQALSVATDPATGPIHRLHFALHEVAAELLPQPVPCSLDVLPDFGAARLDQLQQLVPATVLRVFSRLTRAAPGFEHTSIQPGTEARVTGFSSLIEFSTGTIAELSLDMAAPARLATGWTLQGRSGGYHQGRQSFTVPDGEIYDVPLTTPELDPVEELIRSLLDPSGERSAPVASLSEEAAVLRLMSTIRQNG